MLGLPVPDTKDKQITMFAQGLRNIMSHITKQAAPITPEILVKISNVVNYADQVELVSWVALLWGFHMFLRKSNLVPDIMTTFQPDHQFRRQDVSITAPDKSMLFELRWTKTVQNRQKLIRLLVLPAKNKRICLVAWTYHMFNSIPAGANDPV